MRVLAVVPSIYDTSPGQRFRIEQWEPRLLESGIEITYAPFENDELRSVLTELRDLDARVGIYDELAGQRCQPDPDALVDSYKNLLGRFQHVALPDAALHVAVAVVVPEVEQLARRGVHEAGQRARVVRELEPDGVREVRLPLSWNGIPVSVAHLRSGLHIPQHTHEGRELTLILSGSLRDSHGTYRPGDVADYDSTVSHEQFVDSSEDCLCLVVNQSRLIPQTMLGRALAWISGA